MATISDFQQGDVVKHQRLGEGLVHKATTEEIVVAFGTTDGRGGRTVGRYDAAWFQKYPNDLYVRHARAK